ncbi:MAG: ABC transporter permease [Marinilabiliaceae bacterium]|jgi:molybdate/tungstate transport system permease protein|nr:ABC transporter permease [Marinilabiliaceae bacterium]
MNKKSVFHWVLLVLSSLILLFILAPLLGLVIDTSSLEFFETVRDKEVQESVWLTLSVAFVTTLIFSLGAVPLAWVMARNNFPGKRIVQGLIDLPVVLPHSAAGIALLGLISRDGLLGKAADTVGLSLVGNTAGIALAMAFVSLSFLINSARDGFAAVPERLEKAALNLGASPLKMFFTVSLPLSWRNIASGFVMMFARGMSEFGAIVIIAYHPMTAPVLIYERFNQFGISYARPASLLFILVALVVFIGLRMISMKASGRQLTRQDLV